MTALRRVLAERREPTSSADTECVFVTTFGNRWVTPTSDSVSLQFGKAIKKARTERRAGLGFYSLRHTFRTVADASKDFPAIRLIMGHADISIDAVYREQIDPEWVRMVAEYVRNWLFGDGSIQDEQEPAREDRSAS